MMLILEALLKNEKKKKQKQKQKQKILWHASKELKKKGKMAGT